MRMTKKWVLPLAGFSMTLAACQAHESAPVVANAAPPAPAATVSAAPQAAPTPPTLRLGDAIRPTGYEAALTVVPTEDRFDGHIAIAVDVRAASDVVWLNAAGLDVRSATVNGAPAKVLPGGADFIGIQPAAPLAAGKATLILDYSGEISRKNSSGLFRNKEGDQWYAFTQFEPLDARRVFPCFDEPAFKVPWKLRLKVKRDQVALSNTPVVSENIDGDYKIVQFAETKPLPSYLVALGVGPFDVVDAGTAGKNHTPVRIIVPHGRSAEARFAKETSPQVLNELEAYFGIPYPYEKLDCLDVPLLRGAMENPGLITFAQRLILSPPDRETTAFRHAYVSVAAHEFAHQWFGDLVTTAWWDDIWLNEAFATWTERTILTKWKPEWHEDVSAVVRTNDAMRTDNLVSARRIRQPIVAKDDVRGAFDGITYQKGAAVIGMFENWVGPEVFRTGVRRYLTQYAYGNATADQFLNAVFQGAQAPAVAAFGTFLNQSGIPLLTAGLHCDAGKEPKVALSQERYLPLGSEGSADEKWQIPVCVRYPGKKGLAISCSLLTEARGEVSLPEAAACPAWVDANADGHGYYRVLYEGDGLKKLLGAGMKDLTAPEKVALLGDISALVHNGKISYADALATAAKVARETPDSPGKSDNKSAGVVAATIELVASLRDTPMFADALRGNYARFIRDTYGARAHKLGFAARAGEEDDTRLLRPRLLTLVADEGEDRALQAEAKKRALQWMADRKGTDADLVETVLSIAARAGDRALFDRMAKAERTAASRQERNQILRALGQFRDPDAVGAAMQLTLSDELDARESLPLISDALGTPATRAIAYDFVKQHYDALAAHGTRDGSPYLNRMTGAADLAKVGAAFCDEEHRADLESFFRDKSPHYTGGPRILAQVLESVKLCSAYRTAQTPNVTAFLQKK